MWYLWILSALAFPSELSSALRKGDCTKAVQIEANPVTDISRMAIGECRIKLGDIEEGLALLYPINGPLKPYASLIAANGAQLVGKRIQRPFDTPRMLPPTLR